MLGSLDREECKARVLGLEGGGSEKVSRGRLASYSTVDRRDFATSCSL
jgi:hypothetical protein